MKKVSNKPKVIVKGKTPASYSSGYGGYDAWSMGGTAVKCYSTHPALPIVVEDKTYKVYGGSCSDPVVTDADLYIGLDTHVAYISKAFPWNPGNALHFFITDMSVPKDVDQFKKLIDYMEQQVLAGAKVHVGCIGGHGRTGLVYAALVAQMMGVTKAIEYVRENYCKKAVESTVQINFLHTHYGVDIVKATKEHFNFGFTSGQSHTAKKGKVYGPLKSKKTIWGKALK